QELMMGQISRSGNALLIVADGLGAGLNFVALMLSALLLNPTAAGTIIVAVLVLFFVLRPLSTRARRLGRLRSQRIVEYSESVSEVVRMSEEIQVFGI